MAEKVFGIDISEYQRGMNLTTAKNEGVKFAIIRAGYTGYLNGVSKAKDSSFEAHYKNAKANGLGVGAYWYSCATTYENGKAEAEYMFNNCLKGKQFEYPIYIDVEDNYYQSKAGKTAVTNAIKGFCEYLEAKGYYVGIYASSSWFKNYIDTPKLAMFDKWVANWGKTKPATPEGGMWQFGGSSNATRTNIVAGMVCDQNYAFYDYPSIIKGAGLNGFEKTAVEEKPSASATPSEPKKKTIAELIKETLGGLWGNGKERKKNLEAAGYNYEEVQAGVNEAISKDIEKGDKVKLKNNAVIYGTNTKFAPFVYNSALYVREIDGSRVVISTKKTGAVTGAVDKKYLVKV